MQPFNVMLNEVKHLVLRIRGYLAARNEILRHYVPQNDIGQEPVISRELFDKLWDEPQMPEIIRPQQFVSNPKKKPL